MSFMRFKEQNGIVSIIKCEQGHVIDPDAWSVILRDGNGNMSILATVHPQNICAEHCMTAHGIAESIRDALADEHEYLRH